VSGFRVIVVDDEITARAGVADLVAADPELEVAATCASGPEAITAIHDLEPDLVLLDVQMPRMDGFEVVRAVGPERMPMVVFITAYDQFALKAFEVFAFDYLLKPFDDERFRATMARAKNALRSVEDGRFGRQIRALIDKTRERDVAPEELAAAGAGVPLTRLVVKTGGRVTLLRVEEIDWIEAADYCVRIHSRGRSYMIRESMGSLESRLDGSKFFRTSRSAIVNLDRVDEIQPAFRGEHVIILRDRTKVALSRPRRARLEALLQQRL
jgi:two-component system LytT family response regulator